MSKTEKEAKTMSSNSNSTIGQVYSDFHFNGKESPSYYKAIESSRGVNYYKVDANLKATLKSYLNNDVCRWSEELLDYLGERSGTDIVRRADAYDAVGHELERYDKFGRDISQVKYHPDWLTNLNEVFDFGIVGWNYDKEKLKQYGHAPTTLLTAFDYLVGQADMALCCPLELAHGTLVVLEKFADEELRNRILPAVVATTTKERKQVAQVATEITGGSDVGATRSEAYQDQNGNWYITGEKWFASNVGADLIVTLARVNQNVTGVKGLAMFVVPRVKEDGSKNHVSIRRLKDKMGTIGVPTGELLFQDAEAYLIGKPEDGFKYMADMLNHTRYWNGVGAVGIMRRAFLEAATYTAKKESFGKTIDNFPMNSERLIWMQVDLVATTSFMFYNASTLDRFELTGNEEDYLMFRTLAPVLKYRSGEQNVDFARYAIELMGANGYISTFGTPRLLRDAQVNPIWEGTSNIVALDLIRAIQKQSGHVAVMEHCNHILTTLTSEDTNTISDIANLALSDLSVVIDDLNSMSRPRQEQQARRLADVFGDIVALCAMIKEADTEIKESGDYKKLLISELFVERMNQSFTRFTAVKEAFPNLPKYYPALFKEGKLNKEEYSSLTLY